MTWLHGLGVLSTVFALLCWANWWTASGESIECRREGKRSDALYYQCAGHVLLIAAIVLTVASLVIWL